MCELNEQKSDELINLHTIHIPPLESTTWIRAVDLLVTNQIMPFLIEHRQNENGEETSKSPTTCVLQQGLNAHPGTRPEHPIDHVKKLVNPRLV